MLFRLQKYKKFESNSQPSPRNNTRHDRCFDCKSTKNLRAIHNLWHVLLAYNYVVSTAKVQKIWEQFTTTPFGARVMKCCFDCKSTKNLRAIHNYVGNFSNLTDVVSTAKVQKIWEQFTTRKDTMKQFGLLFRLQKYKKFESNSQLWQDYTPHK